MRLQVSCEDRLGLTRELLARLEEHCIDLRGIELDVAGFIYLNFPELDFSRLQQLMPEIRRIQGVLDVKTVAWMPSEREHHEVAALLKALPDLVFAIDAKGRINHVNEAVLNILRLGLKDVLGLQVGSFLRGFAFLAWLDGGATQSETCKLSFAGEEYLADILPVSIPEGTSQECLAGALVVLKSARRVGHHFSLLHGYDDSRFDLFTAQSEAMRSLLHQARRLAMQDLPLLIAGETGTGKEMLARACHKGSLRAGGPFMTLNCAALPDEVAEHELFGSAPGAFGPAWPGKRGLLEQANGGSFLLDEVAEMSPLLQSKLLRVLEDGRFHRVGQEQEVRVDVRILCTTRQSLAERVRQGRFREDLYFRLSALQLELPPLRRRQADIAPMTRQLVSRICDELQRSLPRLGRSLLEFVAQYPWPGNARQLKNALYQALTLLDGDELRPEDLRLPLLEQEEPISDQWFDGSLPEAAKRFEQLMLSRLYPLYPSSRQLAKRLGISHTAVANKLRDYGIGRSPDASQDD
ncbi:transcriptional regulator TyrR [Pseudaeromonas sp. ZJS20]|uniref:transcriptional regulator TyrR n=1 Tax=Pseudaeromonas aegiceratis TaxID=3153928 RepID=UPI00390CD368